MASNVILLQHNREPSMNFKTGNSVRNHKLQRISTRIKITWCWNSNFHREKPDRRSM